MGTSSSSSSFRWFGMERIGINRAPSIRQIACSSGSRTSIRRSGSPPPTDASSRAFTSDGVISMERSGINGYSVNPGFAKPVKFAGTSHALVILKHWSVFNGFSHKMKVSRALILVAGFAAAAASGQSQIADFSTGQAARLVIGQTNFTTADFGATNTLLGSPSGVAYANGILWVADANRLGSTPNNNRVVRFSDVGTYPSPTADPTI